ncbi:hypothetical protein LOC67_19425 [Stieleria sp. JC731]|uniref:hypothetical protein n=1 Tax=Pirellulaceae TaxID=2691357 RepID=UPI001E3810E4|nr:hypothetical protein [Stieleria sp. JC731]MCC9602726.1 hypothetical protein [Stieleria sp. JC731]
MKRNQRQLSRSRSKLIVAGVMGLAVTAAIGSAAISSDDAPIQTKPAQTRPTQNAAQPANQRWVNQHWANQRWAQLSNGQARTPVGTATTDTGLAKETPDARTPAFEPLTIEKTPLGTAITMPQGVTPPSADIQDNPAIEEAIRRALDSPNDVGPINNPMLGDVINVIRGQKSVLAGSTLEEMLREDQPETSQSDPSSSRRDQSSRQMRAAESLLRSSRLLEQTGAGGDSRDQLIRQMRSEAARLLNEALKPAESSPANQPAEIPVKQTLDQATATGSGNAPEHRNR